MPGIIGLITKKPRAWAEPQLARMVRTLWHEPFYVMGTWIDESLGVYAGWVEREGSFSASMPISNERKDIHLLFSGEEFSEPGIACDLRKKGHNIGAEKNSYLVHLHEEDDAHFPASLNGRFHGLLIDQAKKAVTLFNDRYGMQRVYYHEAADAFYFAPEAKAILGVRPDLRRTDSQGLGEFVACGCALGNKTLFKDIRLLPPGSAWLFCGGLPPKKTTYFEPKEWEEQSTLSPEAYYDELRETFSRRLPRYFNGSQPVAMSLTGGLDSRMILAWHKPAPDSLPCYSFGGMFRDCQDVLLARRVAAARRQPHHVIAVENEFLSKFPRYAERTVYLAEGCVDVSHSPDLYVNERARTVAPVRMTGNYGGEVLRHVRAFKPVAPAEGVFHSEFLPHIQAAAHNYAEQIKTHPLSFAVFRQAPWHHYGLLSLEQTQLSLRSPFLDNEFVRAVFRAPQSSLLDNDVSLRLIKDGDPNLLQIRTDRGLAGNAGRLRSDISRGLLEFSFKAEYAYDYGMPQWVAEIDHLASPLHLERLFLGRHKFKHFRLWYREKLSQYVREMLLDKRTLSRPYLERGGVEKIVSGHLKGNRNYTSAIHKVLTLELVHRLFIDPQ